MLVQFGIHNNFTAPDGGEDTGELCGKIRGRNTPYRCCQKK